MMIITMAHMVHLYKPPYFFSLTIHHAASTVKRTTNRPCFKEEPLNIQEGTPRVVFSFGRPRSLVGSVRRGVCQHLCFEMNDPGLCSSLKSFLFNLVTFITVFCAFLACFLFNFKGIHFYMIKELSPREKDSMKKKNMHNTFPFTQLIIIIVIHFLTEY